MYLLIYCNDNNVFMGRGEGDAFTPQIPGSEGEARKRVETERGAWSVKGGQRTR